MAVHYAVDMDQLRMNEIAFHEWRGERIVSERYFCDPAQRLPLPKAPA